MKESRVAQRYAKAVLDLASEEKAVDAVVEDFKTVGAAIRNSHDLQNFLATPVIDERTKEKILGALFAGKISSLTERFLSLLARKGRAHDLPAIVDAFQHMLDKQRNIIRASITTAVEPDKDQKVRIEKRIGEMTGQSVHADYGIDAKLIGGFTARFEDRMIDASIRHQLERLREKLTSGALN